MHKQKRENKNQFEEVIFWIWHTYKMFTLQSDVIVKRTSVVAIFQRFFGVQKMHHLI